MPNFNLKKKKKPKKHTGPPAGGSRCGSERKGIMDTHQSKKYGQYMEKIGWIVERIDTCQIFIRRFPIIGSLIKIQRPALPIPFKKIEKLGKKNRAFKIIIEPQIMKQLSSKTTKDTSEVSADFTSEVKTVPAGRQELASKTFQAKKQLKKFSYKKSNSPYLPTKTIHIDLTQPEKEILSQMKKKTRYCLRRAQKNGLVVKESKHLANFIKLKLHQFFPLGFFFKKDINALWQTFYPENATLIMAHSDTVQHHSEILAGVLLLFHQKAAHYWLAASTKKGNKLFAPTFLVWEALKLSKKRGYQIFDFEGIYDPRFHQATKKWQGFTRFKKGFGGGEIEYLGCFVKTRFFVLGQFNLAK